MPKLYIQWLAVESHNETKGGLLKLGNDLKSVLGAKLEPTREIIYQGEKAHVLDISIEKNGLYWKDIINQVKQYHEINAWYIE